MNEHAFDLGDSVVLIMSKEKGCVIGRAEYLHNATQYLVRFVAADGRQCENWFTADALASAALTEADALADLAGEPRPSAA